VVLAFGGRIGMEDLAELQRLFQSEAKDQNLVLDLKDVRLVNRDAVASCEASGHEAPEVPGICPRVDCKTKGRKQAKQQVSGRPSTQFEFWIMWGLTFAVRTSGGLLWV
jgi:hypothetical protein